MLLFLFEWLRDALHWKIPAAIFYFSVRMLLASSTSLLLTIFLGPYFIKKLYALKIGQTIRTKEECPLLAQLHGKKKDTPTMGGILLIFSMVISLVLWMDLRNVFTLLLLITTISLGSLGAADDYLKLRYRSSSGLKAKRKMFVQIGFSSLIALYLLTPSVTQWITVKKWFRPPYAKEWVASTQCTNIKTQISLDTKQYIERIYIPFWKDPVLTLDGWLTFFAYLWIVFVITGASNAVNLTDGLDGLAAGCLILVSLVLALFAFFSNHIELARYLNILYIDGSGEIAVYLFALAGACLGFLWYNSYPAQVFMGDTGSLALGGILGVSAILLRREMILAIAGAIFVMEASSVILQVLSYRYRNKRRVFLCAPLHHHFEYKGWPETKIVIRFWIITLLFAIISIISLKLQ